MPTYINSVKKEKDLEKDFVMVAKDRVQTRKGFKQLVLKPVSHFFKWSEYANSGLSKRAEVIKNLCGGGSSALSWLDYPKKIKKSWKTTRKFAEYIHKGETGKAVRKTKNLFIHSVAAAAVVGNVVELGETIGAYTLSGRLVQVLDGIGFLGYIALFWSASHGIIKDAQKLSRFQVGEKIWNLTLTKLIAKVCAVFVSVLGMASFFYGPGLIAKWVVLSVGTTSLLVSIFSHFYNEMYAIDTKNKT